MTKAIELSQLGNKLRVNSTGDVAIGASVDHQGGILTIGDVDSPTFARAAVAIKSISSDAAVGTANLYLEESSGAEGYYINVNADGGLVFSNSGTETTLILDDTNNILVGKTTSSGLNAGCEFRPAGMGLFTRSGANPLQVRRLTDDGDLIEFYQDAGLIGSVRVDGTSLAVGMAGATKLKISSTGKVGIGNVDPANALHIKNDSPVIRLESSASSYVGRNTIGQFQNVLYIECDNDNAISNSATVFNVDGGEELRINSDGQLIHGGVSNPAGYDLVTGGSGYRSILLGSTTGATAAIIIDGAENGDGSGSDYASIEHNTNGEMRYKNRQNSGSGGAGHVFYTTNADTERLRIDSDGRLIAGGADTTLAHANADDLIIGNTSSGKRTGITLVCADNQDAGLYFSDGTSANNANIQGQIVYNHNDTTLKFYTGASPAITIKEYGHTDFTGYADFIRPANDAYSYAGFGPGGSNAKAMFVRRGSEIDLELYSNASQSSTLSINSDGSIFGSSISLQSSATSSWFQTGTSLASSNYVWAAKNSSSNTWHSGLQTDGDLYLGGNLAGTNNIALNGSNGSAWFSGGVGIGGYASANTIDKYEEGSYTPKIYAGTGTTEPSYNWRYGQYVRIGEVVHVWGAMGISGSLPSCTSVYIGNLPYSQSYDSTGFFYYVQLHGYTWASGYGDSGSSTRLFLQSYNGDGTKLQMVNGSSKNLVNHGMIGSGQRFTFQFSYVVG